LPAKHKTLRTCNKGHEYYKSSNCPTCPVCEEERQPKAGFLTLIAAPARRALESHNITSLEQLSTYSTAEILTFHGMGPFSIPKLRQALESESLDFRED